MVCQHTSKYIGEYMFFGVHGGVLMTMIPHVNPYTTNSTAKKILQQFQVICPKKWLAVLTSREVQPRHALLAALCRTVVSLAADIVCSCARFWRCFVLPGAAVLSCLFLPPLPVSLPAFLFLLCVFACFMRRLALVPRLCSPFLSSKPLFRFAVFWSVCVAA